jgi:multiple sugar transport system substrate-binding protein
MPRRTSHRPATGLATMGLAATLLASCGGTAATAPPVTAPPPTAPPATAAVTAAPVPTTAPATATVTTPPAATTAPASEAAGTVEITFWSWVTGIDAYVNQFNAANPGIHVNFVNKVSGDGEYAAFNTAIQAKSGIPDVVQIEYQYLPTYESHGDLLNLADYGANDVKSQFVPWTWQQVSQGDAVYAYPQDSGPMILLCNQDLLTKNGISAAPTTWDEYASDAAKLHTSDHTAYISNFTSDPAWFMGVLWQSGAKPFKLDGQNISINFTSAEAMRVAKLWGDLIKSGNLSPTDTFTNDWNTALGNGTVACWPTGAWGPKVIESAAPTLSGKWMISQMPQWAAGQKVDGNFGGSSDAVTKGTAHPKEAEAFARWLNSDSTTTVALANPPIGFFPTTTAVLADPTWIAYTSPYWSGQKTHQIMVQAAQQVDVTFGWSPFTGFVYTTYADELTSIRAGTITFEQGLQDLQTKVTTYATDQGFTVTP